MFKACDYVDAIWCMSEGMDFSVNVVVLCLNCRLIFSPEMILYWIMGMWFSVAVLMYLFNISIILSIEEVVNRVG